MAVKFDDDKRDRLSELLNDPVQKNRHDIWLWLYLYYEFKADLSLESCNGETMRDEIARALERKERLVTRIPAAKDSHLLPDSSLHWIGDSERQYRWLLREIELMTGHHLTRGLVHLTGRDRLIAMIDLWDMDLAKKATKVERLRQDWLRHKANDSAFEWFADKKDGTKRCLCAWEWLEKKYLSRFSRQTPISNYQELLMFFDEENFGPTELAAMISKIKNRWNRKQFDERAADKKQVNVMLSKTVIAQLDALANKHGLKRAQIIEQLIAGESETEIHLSK